MFVNESSTWEEPSKEKTSEIQEINFKNKIILQDFKTQILTALAQFPELKDTAIRFKYTRNAIFPFASRPNWKTMFKKKEDWEYLILISDSCHKMGPILLKHIPFEGQVGVLGHELAHTSSYLGMNLWQMLGFGLLYFIPKYRKQIENETDRATIAHGLGWQLFVFSKFVRNQKNFLAANTWFDKYYLSTEEILKLTKAATYK